MLTINVLHHGDEKFLNGTLNGEKFNLPYSDDLFTSLKTKQEEYDEFTDAASIPEWETSVKELLLEKKVDIIETACPDLRKNPRTGKYYVVVEGNTSKHAVPDGIVNVILESVEKEISPEPIVKAWIRFLRNPNFTDKKAQLFSDYITSEIVDMEEVERLMDEEGFAENVAIARATYNDVAITKEGLIVCKKYGELITKGWKMDKDTNTPKRVPLYSAEEDVVDKISGEVTKGKIKLPEFSEDLYFQPPVQRTSGDAFFNGDMIGHVMQVGKKISLENWHQINTDDNVSCVKGLHVGGWQYVSSYKSLNCELLECFVDPAEIGAICDIDHSDGAIRVKEYFIYGAVTGRTKGIYHSSSYASMKDEEWLEFKKKAVDAANNILDNIQETIDTLGM